MDIAALVAWIVTALGGFVLLVRWISGGGLRQQQIRTTRFPAPLVFGHFLLAAAGLVVWIVYLAADKDALAWTSFGVLVAVALLGFTLLARWIPVYRAAPAGTEAMTPAERHLPVPVVAAHGLLGATTLVLVLLAACGVGS
ncbi:hypothetical protein [Streptomyces sp. TLI_185]|uniref:hypothetical protein n=1 Tax=Streptomyces sp. TLI_185 TaxID=2485151 RepID=UPI000F4F0520|nr:hypothetical protein [Streptomyces sp. TLI_185]RPF36931.1 hypothetical protein EDD92_6989 [Streptomyces sp. TLI_185]